jgi:hypothetical protein
MRRIAGCDFYVVDTKMQRNNPIRGQRIYESCNHQDNTTKLRAQAKRMSKAVEEDMLEMR